MQQFLRSLGGSSFCVYGPRLAYLLPSIDTRQNGARRREEDHDPHRQTEEVNAAARRRWGHIGVSASALKPLKLATVVAGLGTW